jgi:hypothetical protein
MTSTTFRMIIKRFELVLLASLLFWSLPATAQPDRTETDLFVSPDGSDRNPGTEAKPLATFHGARKAVRKRLRKNDDNDIVVAFSGGRYTIREPVTFGPQDSPSTNQHVIYRAEGKESPVFTGGRRITGWQKNDDGTWSTTIDDVKNGTWTFDELFAGDRRARPARYPDDGVLRVKSIGDDRRTNFTFHEGDIPGFADGHQLHLLYYHDWSISHVPIQSIDRNSHRLTTAYDVGPSADHYQMGHFSDHPRYVLTGDVDFVNNPGEWFLNESTGKLTYMPYDQHRPDRVQMVAPVATSLLEVHGTPDNPVRNLEFRGLTFQHCSFPLPEKGYAAGQATGHEDRSEGGSGRTFVDAALTFDHATHHIVRNCTLSQLGGGGIWFRTGSDNNKLIGNDIRDTGGNGVMIGTGGHNPDRMATETLVVNNRVRRPGQRFFGAVGIWAGIVANTRILHNEVSHTPYTGISLGWQWNPDPTPARRNRVSYNHIHHVLQTLSDGGGIYTLGWHPDSALRGNYIHHVPEAAGRAESNGMFLDQGTKGFTIEHNVIHQLYHSPLRFHQAHQNLVRLNVLIRRNQNVPRIRYNNTRRSIITKRNNTVKIREKGSAADVQSRIDEAGPKPEFLKTSGQYPFR